MPEDYQALAEQLAGVPTQEEPTAQPPVEDAVVEAPEEDSVEEEATAEPEAEQEEADPEKDVESLTKEQQANAAFAQMRNQLSKYQKAFQRIQKATGAPSEDEALERLLEATYGVEAKQTNIDPALLKRMAELEEANQLLYTEQTHNRVRDKFDALQKRLGLSDSDVMKFAERLSADQIDILNSNVNLETLYRGMYYDQITKAMLEKEKQEWVKGQDKANKAPGVTTTVGKKQTGDKAEIKTMAELDAVMKSFPKQ